MLACQVIAAGLCALNTATVPIEAWVGPMGIYIANIIGGKDIYSINWIPFHINSRKITRYAFKFMLWSFNIVYQDWLV